VQRANSGGPVTKAPRLRTPVLAWAAACLLAFGGACGGRPEAEEGGLTVALESAPATLDPRLATDAVSVHLSGLLFNGLTRLDQRAEPVPDLAVRWEVASEKEYRFTLRRGVRFHDGRELTAEDVAFTLRSVQDPALGSPLRGAFEPVERIEVLDRYALRLRLSRPHAPLLAALAAGVVPRGAAAGTGPGDVPVGTGPFRLVRLVPRERVEFAAFPGHFAGPPRLPSLRFRVVPDATTRLLELRKGTVDLLPGGLPPELLPAVRRLPHVRVLTGPSSNTTYLAFNLRDPILRDRRVRAAVASALDRESLVADLIRGLAEPATGLLPPRHWAYEGGVAQHPYDPARARALLDAAGYPAGPDGVRFALTFKATTGELSRALGEILQEALRQVGIRVRIVSHEWGTFFADIRSGNFQVTALTWVGIADPDYLHYIFHSGSVPPAGANRGAYSNPEVDRLLEAARTATNRERRRSLYGRVQAILAEDLPYVFLWHEVRWAAFRNDLRDFRLLPSGDLTALKEASLAR
jgi:peptide/nickel transport system substrate-binding protein